MVMRPTVTTMCGLRLLQFKRSIHKCYVRECLREIPNLPLLLHIIFFGEQAYIIAQ
jgi:hypothetical protein